MKKLLLTMASIASLMLTPLVASAGTPGNWAIGTTYQFAPQFEHSHTV